MSMRNASGLITSRDYERILQLLTRTDMAGKLPYLEHKLNSVNLVEPFEIPANYVTMNSKVQIHDLTTDETWRLTLVYQLSPVNGNQTSILSPLGAALLAAKCDEVITYKCRDNTFRDVRVEEILFQPEAQNQFEL